ncbi:MAG: HAD family hydrolase [Deltaproteobacteria bacterium]|nr:HAD family hydrolase [Deltaproteobacteria bacterium]
MKKRCAVIFDCDGVMFDSRRANINFYNHLLAHFGLPPMTEDKIAFVHMATADESVRSIFEGTPYLEAALTYRMEMDYGPFIRDMEMEPGLRELLGRLKGRFGLAVATNRSNTIGRVLESNGLENFFDIVVSSLDVKRPKPHPECLQKILNHFGIGSRQALYVGDSAVDQETARAAGVPFVAYKNGQLDADHHVNRLLEIIDVADSLYRGDFFTSGS